MIRTTGLQKRLGAYLEKRPQNVPFTREDFAKALQIPIGTASATISHAAVQGLLTHNGGRPRKYSFPEQKVTPSIDELLDLVAEIEAKGIKRSTVAPLLRWIAAALEGK